MEGRRGIALNRKCKDTVEWSPMTYRGKKTTSCLVASSLGSCSRERQVRPVEAKTTSWTAVHTRDHMSALCSLPCVLQVRARMDMDYKETRGRVSSHKLESSWFCFRKKNTMIKLHPASYSNLGFNIKNNVIFHKLSSRISSQQLAICSSPQISTPEQSTNPGLESRMHR